MNITHQRRYVSGTDDSHTKVDHNSTLRTLSDTD